MKKPTTPYTSEFFDFHRDWSLHAAEQIVPLITELVKPNSVIDVGCGDGTWLNVFSRQNVQKIFGIDGDYVSVDSLQIPVDCFASHNLAEPLNKTIPDGFDLVVSLEVGEHLPSASAGNFVSTLTSLGPIVLFSAAAPNQGGTHHVNEQWPDYWAALFDRHGYCPVDCIRRRIWKDSRIPWYYRQNIILFVKQDYTAKTDVLQQAIASRDTSMLSIIHPEGYSRKHDEAEQWRQKYEKLPLREKLLSLPSAIRRAAKNRLPRFEQPSVKP